MAEPQRHPAPHLRVVNPETGELHDECPSCRELRDLLSGAEREVRAWRLRYAEAVRDIERDAKASPLWDEAKKVFDYWRVKCSHPRSRFNADRFQLIEPILREHGADLCRRAIDGAAYDPYITTRRNGSKKRHDDWELIFRNRGKFEEFCNRAPRAG